MATYTAVKAINTDVLWSDPASWTSGDGGLTYPGAADTVETGNFVITFETGKTCVLFRATGTGYFVISAAMTIVGAFEAAGTTAVNGMIRISNATGTVAIDAVTNSSATTNGRAVVSSGAGAVTCASATGGPGGYTYGFYSSGAGAVSIGTATAGTGDYSRGAYNAGANMTVDLAVGGPANTNGTTQGVYGATAASNHTKVKRVQYSTYNAPTAGKIEMLSDATNSASFINSAGGADIVLIPATAGGAVSIEALAGGVGG